MDPDPVLIWTKGPGSETLVLSQCGGAGAHPIWSEPLLAPGPRTSRVGAAKTSGGSCFIFLASFVLRGWGKEQNNALTKKHHVYPGEAGVNVVQRGEAALNDA